MNAPAIDLIFPEIKTPQALKALLSLANIPSSEIENEIKNKYHDIALEFLFDKELLNHFDEKIHREYVETFQSICKNWKANFTFLKEVDKKILQSFIENDNKLICESANSYYRDQPAFAGFANTHVIIKFFTNNDDFNYNLSQKEEKRLFTTLREMPNIPVVNMIYDSMDNDKFLQKLEQHNAYSIVHDSVIMGKIIDNSTEKQIWALLEKNKNLINVRDVAFKIKSKMNDPVKVAEVDIHNTLLDIKKSDLLHSELKSYLKKVPDWKNYKTIHGDSTYHFIAAKNLSFLNSDANTSPSSLIKKITEKNNAGKNAIDIFLSNLTMNSELTSRFTPAMKDVLKQCSHDVISFDLGKSKIGAINMVNVIELFSNIKINFEDETKFINQHNYFSSCEDLLKVDYSKLYPIASESVIAFFIATKINFEVVEKFISNSNIAMNNGKLDLVSILIPALPVEKCKNVHAVLIEHLKRMEEKKAYYRFPSQKEIINNLIRISNVFIENCKLKEALLGTFEESAEATRKRI